MNTSTRTYRFLIAAMLPLLIGCQHTQEKPEAVDDADKTEQVSTDETAIVTDLSTILQDLQGGAFEQAQTALKAYQQQHPNSQIAQRLLEQLEQDPVDVLGAESHNYTIAPNDSISEIAAEQLGDPLLFVALARYNDIQNPSRIMAGQTIRIPSGFNRQPTADEQIELSREQTPPLQALTSVQPEADEAPSDDPAEPFNPQDREQAITALIDEEHWSRALNLIEQTRQEQGQSAHEDWLQPLEQRANAELWQRRGAVLEQQGQTAQALDAYARAVAYQPELSPAAERHTALRDEKISQWHQRAVVLYRNQQLDDALALWDQVLELNPEYAPARSYKGRAQELQRRLQQIQNTSDTP